MVTVTREKLDPQSHHTNGNNLLIGLRGFSCNGAGTSQVLHPDTVVFPDDVSDDVPATQVGTVRKTKKKLVSIIRIKALQQK